MRFLDSPVWKLNLGAGVKPAFPPSLVVQVKALACELPHRLGLPLSRLSIEEIRGQKAIDRFRTKWPNAILIHTPVHASWLNQVEIYFWLVREICG